MFSHFFRQSWSFIWFFLFYQEKRKNALGMWSYHRRHTFPYHSPLIFRRKNSPTPESTYRSIFSIKRKERTLNSFMVQRQFYLSIFSCSPKRKWTKREGRPTKPASDSVGSGFEGGFMLSEFFALPQVNQSSPIHLRLTLRLENSPQLGSTYGKNDD